MKIIFESSDTFYEFINHLPTGYYWIDRGLEFKVNDSECGVPDEPVVLAYLGDVWYLTGCIKLPLTTKLRNIIGPIIKPVREPIQ